MSVNLGTLTILDGQTESEVLDFTTELRHIKGIAIHSPATMTETVNPRASAAIAGTYYIMRSDGTDIAVIAQRVETLDPIDVAFLRLVATTGVSGDKVFQVTGREWPE